MTLRTEIAYTYPAVNDLLLVKAPRGSVTGREQVMHTHNKANGDTFNNGYHNTPELFNPLTIL